MSSSESRQTAPQAQVYFDGPTAALYVVVFVVLSGVRCLTNASAPTQSLWGPMSAHAVLGLVTIFSRGYNQIQRELNPRNSPDVEFTK
ncbi:hypothetical protein DL767_003984 [Monosporascus sp. MG133]|nr:hypothetical protein DL767_003984 [Monosporascus sp. MG133]